MSKNAKEEMRKVQKIRVFLSDCYSFLRAEIKSEEIGTFGINDAITARIAEIKGPTRSGRGKSRLDRVTFLEKQVGDMVKEALRLKVDNTKTLKPVWSGEGALGGPEEKPQVLEKDIISVIEGTQPTSDSAENINYDESPNASGSPEALPGHAEGKGGIL